MVWQPAAALPFLCTLRSDSQELLNAASTLFAPWLLDITQSALPNLRRAQWLAEEDACAPPEAGRPAMWSLTGPDGSPRTGLQVQACLMQIEYEAIWHLAKGLDPEFTAFHGALLRKNGRGVLILGTKESGKSTLSCALWRAGWSLLSDDCVLLDSNHLASACARRVSLRKSARALWEPSHWQALEQLPSSLDLPESLLFHPHEFDAGTAPERGPMPLDAMIFLGRYGAGSGASTASAGARRVPPAQAAMSLLAHSSHLWKESTALPAPRPDEWMPLLPRVTPVVEAVPAFDMFRDNLPAMVGVVEKIVAEVAS